VKLHVQYAPANHAGVLVPALRDDHPPHEAVHPVNERLVEERVHVLAAVVHVPGVVGANEAPEAGALLHYHALVLLGHGHCYRVQLGRGNLSA
jgi:hypothetical protein